MPNVAYNARVRVVVATAEAGEDRLPANPSTTDDFTPYEQTDEIYANSNQDHTVYELTEYGALHPLSYVTDPVAYTEFVHQFLATFVPEFGGPRPPAAPDA